MNNSKGKTLRDGAIIVVLTVWLMAVAMTMPLFALAAVMVAGIPVAFMSVRHGVKPAAVSAVAATLICGACMGDFLGVAIQAVVNLLPGLVIGYVINRRAEFRTMVLAASGAVLLGLMLQVVLLNISGDGNGIANLIDATMESSRQMLQQTVDRLGDAERAQISPMMDAMSQAMDLVKELILLYLPALVIATSCVLGYGAVAASIFMLHQLRAARVRYLPFSMFHAPRSMCYLSVILYLVSHMAQEVTVFTASLQNLTLLLDCFIGVCGLSLIDYKFKEKISSGCARAGIYLAVLAVGYVAIGFIGQALMFLGLLDGMLHFRRFHKVGENHGKNK